MDEDASAGVVAGDRGVTVCSDEGGAAGKGVADMEPNAADEDQVWASVGTDADPANPCTGDEDTWGRGVCDDELK